MSELLEFKSDHGAPILVEVEGERGGRVTRGGGQPTDAVIEAGASLEQVLSGLGPAINGIVAQLRAAADWPDEVAIEFGVRISGGANIIIARTGGEANFSISMKWSRAQEARREATAGSS